MGKPLGKSASSVMQKDAILLFQEPSFVALFTSGIRRATMICEGRRPNSKTAAGNRLGVRVPLPPLPFYSVVRPAFLA